MFLKSHSDELISWWKKLKFQRYVHKRQKKIPVAYILGYKEWAGMKISVNEHVLIPRDETEILCETIAASSRDFIPQKILDVGTGSGNIACFLKQKYPEACVMGVDISPKALSQAKRNAKSLGLGVSFQLSDLLSDVSGGLGIIVANLPYVPEKFGVSSEVQKEPSNAIFSGNDGLNHIRRLAEELGEKEILFGELWLEFFPQQKGAIENIFSGCEVEFFEDSGGEVFFAKVS